MKTITALVTPLLNDGQIDYKSLEKLIEFQIAANIDGILFAGSTGEKFGLSEEAFFNLCKCVVNKYKGKFEIIFNIGTFSTKETIYNAKKCEEIGVDSILVVNPYYIKVTQEGLYNHFKKVAQSVKIPVYLYNIPGRTSVNLNVDTLKRLIEVENILGIKDSTGNLSQLMEVLALKNIKKNFKVFCGDDGLMYPFFSLGADGVISVITNIFPKEVKNIADSFNENSSIKNLNNAREIFFKIFELSEAVCKIGNNPIGIKTILAKEGFILENFFEPLCSLNASEKEKLFGIFEKTKRVLDLY